MAKQGLFFISDYRDVTCEPGRDPAYWILKGLDRDSRFNVYGTANKVINSNCFRNINVLTLDYKGKIGSRFVGNGDSVFTIAEAGANHNQELDTAKMGKTEW